MDLTLIIGAVLLINIVGLIAIRMRKPAAAGGAMTVEATQAAMGRNKQERFVIIDRILRRRGPGKLERNLVTAGLMMKPAEFMMVNLFFFAITLVGGSFILKRMPAPDSFSNILKFFGAAFIIFYIGWKLPQMILQFLADKRRTTLEVQLADALAIISSGLKGGYSFVQGLSMASEQLPTPINGEFQRVIRLVQLGLDTPRALEQMSERINSYDYDMTVSATNIQLSSGGNLSKLLETIAETIRDRIRLRRDIAALTAQGRMSGGILIALPIGIGIMLSMINPEYFGLLFSTTLGNNLILLAVIQQAIGIYWIKKLLDFDN
ncbi:MAG TPA: type II secretion system F family protein [Abditibacteriaceae bacterium]|jgi:tight adherence protein B